MKELTPKQIKVTYNALHERKVALDRLIVKDQPEKNLKEKYVGEIRDIEEVQQILDPARATRGRVDNWIKPLEHVKPVEWRHEFGEVDSTEAVDFLEELYRGFQIDPKELKKTRADSHAMDALGYITNITKNHREEE